MINQNRNRNYENERNAVEHKGKHKVCNGKYDYEPFFFSENTGIDSFIKDKAGYNRKGSWNPDSKYI